jgi:hypothetical protein
LGGLVPGRPAPPRQQPPAASHQPATSNQQPARSQQSAATSQSAANQPAVSIRQGRFAGQKKPSRAAPPPSTAAHGAYADKTQLSAVQGGNSDEVHHLRLQAQVAVIEQILK